MTTSLSNITVKDGTNTLIVKANDITINGSSILATNNFVTLDTDQDIKAHKWFREVFYKKGMNDDWTTAPSEQTISSIGFTDKNNIWLGGLECEHLTDGTYRKSLYARQQNGNGYAAIRVGIKSDGTSYAEAPTPSSVSDSTSRIATTAWVQSRLSNLSIQQINTTIDKTKTLTADTWGNNYYIQADKNGSRTFFMQMRQYTNDAVGCHLCVQNGDPSNSTQYYTYLDLIAHKNQNSPQIASSAHFDISNYVAAITGPVNFIAQNNSITPGSTPSSNQYVGYDFRGNNNTRLAYLGIHYLSNGAKGLELQKLHSDLSQFNMSNWVTAHNQIILGNGNTSNSYAQIRLFNKAYTNGTPTSTSTQRFIEWYDASSTQLGYINLNVDTSENRIFAIRANGKTSSAYSQLVLQVLSDGNSVAIFNSKVNLPTPATSSNEATAATTAYVNNKHQVVSALPASPDSNVFYYIPA